MPYASMTTFGKTSLKFIYHSNESCDYCTVFSCGAVCYDLLYLSVSTCGVIG